MRVRVGGRPLIVQTGVCHHLDDGLILNICSSVATSMFSSEEPPRRPKTEGGGGGGGGGGIAGASGH